MAKKDLINEEEFPSNSKSSSVAPIRSSKRTTEEDTTAITPTRTRTGRVAQRKAIQKKKTFAQSIAASLAGDDTRNVGLYVLNEVLIPAAKNLVQEMVTSGLEMMLFGETSGRSRSKDKSKSTVSYGSYYKSRDREEPKRRIKRDKFDLTDIFFDNHTDAEDVLEAMMDHLEEYEQITVADFFDMAGIDGATWVHNDWGWTDLRKARLTHTRYGYAIMLPDPEELD